MTADLLICWYALGYVACGADVALMAEDERHSIVKLFTVGPIMLAIFPFATLVAAIMTIRPDPSKQYLWRRRK